VLCRQCESKPVTGYRRTGPEPEPVGPSGSELRKFLCDSCGAVLPASQADEFLLRRLTQFARFGLDADSAPLLTNTSEPD
jgi:hypothetical protein